MLKSGRRRAGTLSSTLICLALLFLFTSSARAAVLGIDFGTQNIKAALVKPGIPLDIVLTKDSKRKEIAAVAFKPNRDDQNNIVTELGAFPERAYGSDALALQGRTPGEVFPNLKMLLGMQWGFEANKTAGVYLTRYPAVRLSLEKDFGTTVFKSSTFVEDMVPFSVEELIGMQLANIRRNAEAMAGGMLVEDAVITVPAFYSSDEKLAIAKAAGFAGLSVSSLISDGLAVGLDYAKTRSFPEVTKGEQPEYHMVYDMGAGSTTATLMRFQSRSVKDVGRFNKTIQEVAVLGTGWDKTLGGDALNDVIMDDFVTKLLAKPTLKSRGTSREEITSNGRLMSRFFKEAERVRQILSANTETSSTFEEILPDIDLRTKLSRTQFEGLIHEYAHRVEKPILDALAMAKMRMDQVDSIILHGGAVRTPFVQANLEEAVGDSAKLRSNVNADESAVFGAAFKAASLSPSFKVKEIWSSDIAGYETGLMYLDTEKDRERKKPLFAATAPVGPGSTTKQVNFKDKEDFAFGFVQNVKSYDRAIRRVQTENLTLTVDELVRRFACDRQAVKTQFSVRLGSTSGLPEVVSAAASCEVDGSAKQGSVGDTVKDWLGFGKKKEQEPVNEDGQDDGPTEQVEAEEPIASTTAAESNSSSTETASSSSGSATESAKTHIETIPIRFSSISDGNPQPAIEELIRMRERLEAFDESDRSRLAREEAQNVLESYTYFVRDFLENSDYEQYSTATQRDALNKLLQSTKQWMDSSGELHKATKETLSEKQQLLKDLVEPIKTRRRESESRPGAIEKLKTSLGQAEGVVGVIKEQIEKAAAGSSGTADAGASRTPAASSDGIDDLEEKEASSTIEEASPPSANPLLYASLDLTEITETLESIKTWMAEKETEQDKLQPFEEPSFVVKDIEAKALQLAEALQTLVKQKNKAERDFSLGAKKAKTSKTKSSKTAAGTAAPGAEEDGDGAEIPAGDDVPEPSSEQPKAQSKPSKPKKKKVSGGETIEDMMNWKLEPNADTKPGSRDEL